MNRWKSACVAAVLVMSGAAMVLAFGTMPFDAAKSASAAAEVQLPAKSEPGQRTALDLEVVFGKGSRGGAVIIRHQPSGEVIGTVTPFGLGTNGGVGRFALIVPQALETQLRKDHEPLRLTLETTSGASNSVELRSVAPKLIRTAR